MNDTRSAPAGGTTIEGIQVLRGVAALLVVLHHARHSVPGSEGWPVFGAAGVDIFFVISGFVMALTTRNLAAVSSLAQRAAASSEFIRKRIARVLPLYWLALLWTSRRELLGGQIGSDLLKDFAFLPHPNAVYPDMLWPTVIQGWTLNYEMFFYLLFALTMLCGAWRTVVLIVGLLGLVAVGQVLALPAGADAAWQVAARFYTHDILLEFGYGVLLHRVVTASRPPAWPRAVFVGLMAVGFVWLAAAYDHTPRGVMQGVPALLIVWASLPACAGLRSRLLLLLGDASYAIYLFHWASFGAVKPVAGWLGAGATQPAQVAVLMGLHVAVAVVSGVAIHWWVERPLLRWSQAALGVAPKPVRAAAPA